MAQPGQISGSSTDYSSAASSYSSNHASFPLQEEDNHRFHQLEFRQPGIEYPQHHYIGLSYRGNYFEFHDLSVSMTLILGVYGAMRLSLGPKCSILLQPNPIFVQSIKVEQLYDTNPGLMLYGFSKPPQLDVVQTWSSTLNFSVLAGFHKAGVVSCAMESDFVYFLNEGSQINISYRVNSPSSSVFLVIAQAGKSQGLKAFLSGLRIQLIQTPLYHGMSFKEVVLSNKVYSNLLATTLQWVT
ncbi:E3 UBIQUITIN-PROTEIN LIGASE APD1-RELATED [Salix purpurea]|uniref:E3 UBIQUITIN-PROTEIN LIGASE APD1-RELATED n=1 Tax=Salix purpurea TaxID=77065 RepID=A0A9Q0Q478_SALPP|nr:E3 UBIQUITIN-PROTEIN LIGASE APD1-RELATED [Salix purpurea]